MLSIFSRSGSAREGDEEVSSTGRFAGMTPGHVPALQRYFIEIVNSVSIPNMTRKLLGQEHNQSQLHRDCELVKHISDRALAESGVSAEHLRALLDMYLESEPSVRAKNKAKWVERAVSGRIPQTSAAVENAGQCSGGPEAGQGAA